MSPIFVAASVIVAIVVATAIGFVATNDIQVVVLGILAIPLALNSIPWSLATQDEGISEEELDHLLEQRRLQLEERDHKVQGIGFTADVQPNEKA